jgi:putative transposase
MSTDRVPLLDLLRNAGIDPAACLRLALERFLQDLMEADVAARIGADRYARTPDRTTHRNGHRDRALAAGFQEAWGLRVSTRKVDELVQALGMTGLSQSAVSALCQRLDERGEAFRTRARSGPFPYVGLDAQYLKVREGDRVRSMALVVATGVNAQGDREVLGCEVGPREDAEFWTRFLRHLLDRGLTGVQLVISDAHRELQHAIRTVLQGASWPRCRVHALRNLLAPGPKSAQAMVAALVRTIFVQPDKRAALIQLNKVAETLQPRFPPGRQRPAGHGGGSVGIHACPGRARAADRFNQPAGTSPPREGAPHGCRGDLPEPPRRPALGRCRAHGAARRMARRPAALFSPGVAGQARARRRGGGGG